MRLATRTQSLELDRRAQSEYGIGSSTLMDGAVDSLERALRQFYPAASGEQVWVVAGPGKNGEDGRRLAGRVGARVFSCAEFLQIRFEAKLPAVVIDAILGIGQSRAPEGELLLAIHEINHLRAKGVCVLAVDTPTGLDLDTGNILGEAAVVANQTVTFGFAKPGFFLNQGPGHVGRLVVDHVGFPAPLMREVSSSHCVFARNGFRELSQSLMPRRGPESNKTHFGHTVVVGGSKGMEGAAVLASRAAFRVGSGYVTWVPGHDSASSLDALPHAMRAAFDDVERIQKASAVIVGPGLGLQDAKRAYRLLEGLTEHRVVIDAGALSFLSHAKFMARLPGRKFPEGWLLTPHAGEAAKLMGVSSREIEANRTAAAAALCAHYGGVVLLKGFHSVVAMPSRVVIVDSGSAALAKAGTGDVLSGMIGGFAAQMKSMRAAALLGCYLHGAIADHWVGTGRSKASLEATDLIEMIPTVFSRLSDRS
ncbi:MAG: NAD(P)H-hydrate dehydratase [Bdellovibrionales bacterium]|nr:NAD(P)H-hydrate dehydratase [Bdellovibrionales bacterium]